MANAGWKRRHPTPDRPNPLRAAAGTPGPVRQDAAIPESGLVAGTRIATEQGWRAVESLCAGDRVITFDDGARPLRSITRRLYPDPLTARASAQPLTVLAAGTVGNEGPLAVLPGQVLVYESDVAEALYGDPFALVPAGALRTGAGATAILSDAPIVVVTLAFEEDQLVFADGQALLYCEVAWSVAPPSLDDALFGAPPRYTLLDLPDALRLVKSSCEAAVPRSAALG